MPDTKEPTFHGFLAREYPGGPCSGCAPNDDQAVSWMAVVDGHIYNMKTPMEVVRCVRTLLKGSYEQGRQTERDALRQKLGL